MVMVPLTVYRVSRDTIALSEALAPLVLPAVAG